MSEVANEVGNEVLIYTDGACRGNPGPGGWGAWLKRGAQETELAGAFEDLLPAEFELPDG